LKTTLGTELARLPKATGTRGQLRTAGPGREKKGKTGVAILEAPVSDSPTLAHIGVEFKRSARAQKIAEIPLAKLDEIAADLADQGKAISPTAILASMRQTAKQEKVHAVAIAAFGSVSV
jgi:hypothetical protein